MKPSSLTDGIYETKSFPSQQIWPKDRRVYIQGNSVKLVDYKIYGLSEEEQKQHERLGYSLFHYDWFFQANILGPRVGDLPENFDIRKHSDG